MRRIIWFLTILSSVCCFSQVNEDFSDGDFTHDPVWNGNADKFIVNKTGELKLNDQTDKAGPAYLSTRSSILRGGEWSFYINLQFNPSANNYAKFYLASSSDDLTGELDGYYLLIGGKEDKVSLFKQSGNDATELICGASKMVGINSPELHIKVTCDLEGKWVLYTSLLNWGEDYIEEGNAIDKAFKSSSYVGLVCYYTSSRSSHFKFDDLLIKVREGGVQPEEPTEPSPADPNDKQPPTLLSIYACNDSTIELTFDEEVDLSMAKFIIGDLFTVKQKNLSDTKKIVSLVISGKLEDSLKYSFYMNGVKDLSGNIMMDLWIDFVYYDSSLHTVNFGDVVFNEIMANPKGVAALPEVEYLELYNRTERPINLAGWKYYYNNKGYVLKEGVLLPESYLVLCNEKIAQEWEEYNIAVTGVKSFPELANSGRLLYLEDARGNIVAWVEYSDTWYGDDFKKKGGFSLECIDADNFSNDTGNWQGCKDLSGGTPGRANSVNGTFSDETTARVDFAYLSAPDTLLISFTKPMNLVSLATLDNYTVIQSKLKINNTIPKLPMGKEVKLALSEDLTIGEILEIELKRIEDISGYLLDGNLTIKLGLSETAEAGDILFNELLFDPFPGGNDYVELYNNSTKYIDLSQLYFSGHNPEGGMGEGYQLYPLPRVFPPYSYLCFTTNIPSVSLFYQCEELCMIEANKLPSLPDARGNIVLLTSSAELIDEVSYTSKMHTALLNDCEGISLEKTYPTRNSLVTSNWVSASSVSGGGTPGYQNSQFRESDINISSNFWLERKSFSPDGDGYEDELFIFYKIEEENAMVSIKIYDASGRFVCDIVSDCRLEPEGHFVWNGKEQDDRRARMGLYIVFVEVITPTGERENYKLGCALSR